ncbi:hypothetical protein V1515DRAFT_641247 [Lipomyces mesembrius]
MDNSGPVNNLDLLFTFPGTVHGGNAPQSKRKRKHRVIRSCVNCHRRKVKCDKLTPACNNCVKLDLECQYHDNVNDGVDVLDELAPGVEGEEETDFVEVASDVDNGNVRRVDVGYLSVDPTTGGSGYANGAFWGAYFKEMVDMSTILKSRDETFNMDAITRNETASSLLHSYFISNSNAYMDILFQLSQTSLSPTVLFSTIFLLYQVDTPFLALFFVTLYGATLSICESSMFDIFSSPNEIITVRDAIERQMHKDASSEEQRVLQNKYKLATDIALSGAHFPAQPSLQGLQTSVILNTCLNVHTTDAGTGTVAMLIRVAQMMGLHRDPSNFPFSLSLKLPKNDVSSGLPPIVHRVESDVKLPSECVMANGEEHKDHVDCHVLTMNAVSEGSLLNCMILLTAYGVQKCNIQQINTLDEEILRVRPRMEARCRELMLLEDDDPRSNDEDVNSKSRGPNESSVREKVLKAAINTLYYYLGFSKMPEFLVYVWYIRFLQPFHAIIIVLQDLYLINLCFLNLVRLRVVEQVFQVLHLLRIAEKSAAIRHAWNSINKLRTGTWLKIRYLHPIGLPLVSSNLPPEYANLVPLSEENFVGDFASTLEALIQQTCTLSDQSSDNNLVQPLPPALSQFMTQSANVVMSSDIDASVNIAPSNNIHESSDTGTSSNLVTSTNLDRDFSGISSACSASTSSTNSILSMSPSKMSNASSSPEYFNSGAVESHLSLESDLSDGIGAAPADNYDELFDFAARMENDTWDRWDMLLKG